MQAGCRCRQNGSILHCRYIVAAVQAQQVNPKSLVFTGTPVILPFVELKRVSSSEEKQYR
jgi:hypothetical protein